MCGCAKQTYNYEGKDLIDKAAEIHTGFESAWVTIYSDELTDKQSIVYRFEGEVMQYMYSAHIDGKTYYEFNNGTELNYITLPDETEWSFTAKGSEDYYSYSKASRHYFADGSQLFTDYEAAVSGSEITEIDGSINIKLSYDLEKLSQYSAFAGYEFTDFSMEFFIDKENGRCLVFSNEYTLADGTSHSYQVTMLEKDANEPIERIEIE